MDRLIGDGTPRKITEVVIATCGSPPIDAR